MSPDQPRLDPIAQLLVLCARPQLNPAMRESLRALLAQELDWDRLITAARRNFIVVLLRKHLLEHAADLLPREVLGELDRLRKINAARSLEIVRIQRLLATEVLDDKHGAYAFFKGATLSNQYYGDTYLRQYRDIDVLLDRPSLIAAGTRLVGAGFKISNPPWLEVRQLDAYLHYNFVLELRSPSGIAVELHRTLDNSGCVFPTDDFLKAATSRHIDGTDLRVLPCTELFTYLCFHHSKHRWSSLHWCADLQAFWRHPELDQAAVSALAGRLGLAATVDESWKLRSDLELLATHGMLPRDHQPSRLLADCIAALKHSIGEAGDPAVVADETVREPDFPYGWQKSAAYRWRIQWARLHPSAYDYYAWPLPVRWHWLYYLVKPMRVVRSRWGRLWKHQGATR